MGNTFTIEVPRTYTFEEGWGVVVIPIHAGEDWSDPDAVVDLDADIVRIDQAHVVVRHDEPLVEVGGGMFIPVENFADDQTEEYGDRWFATHVEAANYLAEVEGRAAAIRSWFD